MIPVLKGVSANGWLTAYLDGLHAYVSDSYVCAEQEESYETWDGRTKSMISVYEDFWMLGSPVDRLNANTVVTVLYELDNCYFVETGDVTGYIPKDIIPVKTESNPEATAPTQPVQSRPTEPIPTEPEQSRPTEPAPTEPQTRPTEPAPTEPPQTRPAEPAQTEPEESTTPTENKPEEEVPEATAGTEPEKIDPEWTPPVL